MSIITRMRKQDAVWWGQNPVIPADSFGNPLFLARVQIKVRWEDEAQEFIGKDGTPQVSHSIIYVDRDMQIGDILWLGLIAGLTDPTNPRNNSGWVEVKAFSKLPNLRNTEYLRTVHC